MPVAIKKKIVIAIDGYSSCGKSTLAKALAKYLSYAFVDSGSMYRAVTLFFIEMGLSVDKVEALPEEDLEDLMNDIHVSFNINPTTGLSEVSLNGVNVEYRIRTLEVSDRVSPISAIPVIRHRMVALQKSYGLLKGIVMDGRDIGTTVFPEAELKIFMTADKNVRAQRRYDELTAKGFTVTMEEVFRNIEERDHADTHRAESPLRKADDAILLDNSHMSEEEQFEFAKNELYKLGVIEF